MPSYGYLHAHNNFDKLAKNKIRKDYINGRS